jgi:hypothetical protein
LALAFLASVEDLLAVSGDGHPQAARGRHHAGGAPRRIQRASTPARRITQIGSGQAEVAHLTGGAAAPR